MADQAPKEERTEEATAKRREDARSEGQVALSQDFMAAMMLLAAGVGLSLGAPALLEATGAMTAGHLQRIGDFGTAELDLPRVAETLRSALDAVALPVLLPLAGVVAMGVLAGYGQIGYRVTTKALEPKLSRFDPLKGFGRILGWRSLVRVGLAGLKIVGIATVLIATAWWQFPRLLALVGSEIGPLLRGGATIVALCLVAALLAVLAIALLDLVLKRQQHSKDLRMTKDEVKRERKQDEGDPLIKSRIRTIQREVAMRRMMEDVPKATVVVTNPTHYAVALSYEPAEGGALPAAPRVVAKGVDALAQRIKAVATAADVPLYEDVPLARSLYAQTEVGDEVPEALYQAVATVIQFVWRLRGRTQLPAEVAR